MCKQDQMGAEAWKKQLFCVIIFVKTERDLQSILLNGHFCTIFVFSRKQKNAFYFNPTAHWPDFRYRKKTELLQTHKKFEKHTDSDQSLWLLRLAYSMI